MVDLSWFFWLFFLAQFFVPLDQKQTLALRREGAIRGPECRRWTRLITMSHRQETVSFLGFPIAGTSTSKTRKRSSARSG